MGNDTMINETKAAEALVSLFRAGIQHWDVLRGVAYAMSCAGKGRLEIVNFFWHLMNAEPPILSEEEVNLLDDFTSCLLARSRLEHIIRLHGDPEDLQQLGHLVATEAENWRPPK